MVYSVRGKGKHISRVRRHQRMCKHIFSSAGKPRLVVTRSDHHMVTQLVDDYVDKTLVSASAMEDTLWASSGKRVDKAREVGKLTAQRAKTAGIAAVVFGRGGNKYYGRITAVTEGAREGGLSL